jgi:hypothetical protein
MDSPDAVYRSSGILRNSERIGWPRVGTLDQRNLSGGAVAGTPVIAAWIGRVAFWVLLPWGLASGELGIKSAGIFLTLWLFAFVGFGYLPVPYSAMFPPFVAVLDVVLVLFIFKGDIPIT